MAVERVLDGVELESVELFEIGERVALDVDGRILLILHVVPQNRHVDELGHSVRIKVLVHGFQHARERRGVPAKRHRKACLTTGRRLLFRLHQHFDAVVVDVDHLSVVVPLANRVAHLRFVV